MTIIIREALERDIDQLIRMRWDFTWENRTETTVRFEDFVQECRAFLIDAVQSDRWKIWVAEAEGKVVSHVYVQLIDKVPRPGRVTHPFGYVTNVYTLPEYRSRGIGGKVMEAVKLRAQASELEFLIVWPAEESIPFYRKTGFRLCTEPMELHLERESNNGGMNG